jgi:hypothetical protein
MKTAYRIALIVLALSIGVVPGVAAVLWRMEYNPVTGNFGDRPTQVEPAGTPPTPPLGSPRPAPAPCQHTPDAVGWCAGCLTLWGRLAPSPCESARSAAAVRAAYTGPPD